MTKQSVGRTWGYVRRGWLLWMGELNSPWLPMSVRASKNWYYWQQNPFLLLHLGKAWNFRINSISSHSARARAGPLARGLAAVDGRAELIAHDCQCQSELFLSEIRKKMHGWDCIFWLLQHRSSNHWATTIEAMLLLSRYLSSLLHIPDVTREFFCYMA